MFCKIDVLNNFSNFSGKNLCRIPFFLEKIVDWRSATLLKRDLDIDDLQTAFSVYSKKTVYK